MALNRNLALVHLWREDSCWRLTDLILDLDLRRGGIPLIQHMNQSHLTFFLLVSLLLEMRWIGGKTQESLWVIGYFVTCLIL